jgi:putative NADH-flavin reductase
MRLAIFGGTGRVGRRLIEYATGAGHEVRALVRDPRKLPPGLARLESVTGDATNADAVLKTVTGAEAVVSALGGAGLANPGTVLSDGMKNIVAAMARASIRRVLAVAGAGVLDSPTGGLRGEAADFPAVYRAINHEHIGTWRALQASDLDWTLVCCPDLVDGELTQRFRVSRDTLPEGAASISVEDVAAFMLEEVTHDRYFKRRVGLAL